MSIREKGKFPDKTLPRTKTIDEDMPTSKPVALKVQNAGWGAKKSLEGERKKEKKREKKGKKKRKCNRMASVKTIVIQYKK